VSRPRLFERLAATARVTVASAPPGSGKTVLLRSGISQAGLADSAAWVPVGRGERDPQRFWLAVLGALRQTAPGLALVRPLTAAPDLDGWAITERLVKDLAPLADRVWLVNDDVHEVRLGETEHAEQALAGFDGYDRDFGEPHIAQAVLRLTQADPYAVTAALAPSWTAPYR
jgi:LuxR family maltose regulon positive regulatory protein